MTSDASAGSGGFDWPAFVARVGDADVARSMIDVFLTEDLPRLTADLDAAIASGDAGGVRHAAHAMKGGFAELGAEGARGSSARLERMGADGELDGVAAVHEALVLEIDRLRDALASRQAGP